MMLDYLSGNVPGGILVYLLIIATLFLVLFSISRHNDLFTPAKSRWWFTGVFLFLTAVYVGFWFRDPPAATLSRYTLAVKIETPQHRWVAKWLQEEMESVLPAYIDQGTYLYRGNQLPGSAILVTADDEKQWQQQIAVLAPENVIVATLYKDGRQWQAQLQMDKGGNRAVLPVNIPLDLAKTETFSGKFREWSSALFKLTKERVASGNLSDSLFMTAKVFFDAGEYQKSQNLCVKTRKREGENTEIKRLENFNRIRLANIERMSEDPRNPFDHQLRPWQQQLQEARSQLITLIKDKIDAGKDDPQLYSMMAESFIQEEMFVDAEEFLKLAYTADPFDANVLENLSLLHPSRYAPLGFRSEKDILQRMLDLYPANIPALTRFVEKELLSVPVKDAATENARKRLDNALQLNPNSLEALILKGKFLIAIFQYQQALTVFAKADSLQPNNATIKYNMGICAFKLNNLEKAEQLFRNAVTINDFLDAHLYLGVIYQKQEQYQKALAAFRYRVANKTGVDDYYALQAMKGIRECLEALNIPIPQQ